MRRWLALAVLSLAPAAPAQDSLTLWYKQPAKLWVEALPVGNGRMGAMIFGGVSHERIQFNESTVWTGEPHDYAHHGASQHLPKIRELLFAGKQKEAEDLAMKEFMSEPIRQQKYQAFGDLLIDYPGIDGASVTGYRRDLNLQTAVSTVEFKAAGVTYRREVFASYPGKVIVVRVSASRSESLTFDVGLKSAHAGGAAAGRRPGDDRRGC
jgi:alpha-L-fucosidase 2